jgi:hypothetical protein
MMSVDQVQQDIDMSDSGKMLWITEPGGQMHILGGEGDGTANVLVSTTSGEASLDLSPQAAGAAARCLAAYASNDLVLVDRQALNALMTATSAAEAVLGVLGLGKPLRLALQRLRTGLARPLPREEGES